VATKKNDLLLNTSEDDRIIHPIEMPV
jgi:hypothetical protein